MITAARRIELLSRIPLFSGVSKGTLRRLAALGRETIHEPGKAIVREGATAHALHVIVEGTATVRVTDRVVSHLKPGDFFGEIALLDKGPRAATVSSRHQGGHPGHRGHRPARPDRVRRPTRHPAAGPPGRQDTRAGHQAPRLSRAATAEPPHRRAGTARSNLACWIPTSTRLDRTPGASAGRRPLGSYTTGRRLGGSTRPLRHGGRLARPAGGGRPERAAAATTIRSPAAAAPSMTGDSPTPETARLRLGSGTAHMVVATFVSAGAAFLYLVIVGTGRWGPPTSPPSPCCGRCSTWSSPWCTCPSSSSPCAASAGRTRKRPPGRSTCG